MSRVRPKVWPSRKVSEGLAVRSVKVEFHPPEMVMLSTALRRSSTRICSKKVPFAIRMLLVSPR